METRLYFAGIVMDSFFDEADRSSFFAIPAEIRGDLSYYPVCYDFALPAGYPVVSIPGFPQPGDLVRCQATEIKWHEDPGSIDTQVLPETISIINEPDERLALAALLLDPLQDAAMLDDDPWWGLLKSEKHLSPGQLLELCLKELKLAGRLEPDALTRRMHGWISGWLLTFFSGETTGIPGLIFHAAMKGVGGPPRIFVCRGGVRKAEPQSGEGIAITIETSPKILDGTVFTSPQTLAQCLEWVRINHDALLKHWEQESGSEDLLRSLVPLGEHARNTGR